MAHAPVERMQVSHRASVRRAPAYPRRSLGNVEPIDAPLRLRRYAPARPVPVRNAMPFMAARFALPRRVAMPEHRAVPEHRLSHVTPFTRTIVREAPFEQVISNRRTEKRGDRDSFVQTVYVTRPGTDAVYQRWVRQSRDYDRWMHRRPHRYVAYGGPVYTYNYYTSYFTSGYRQPYRSTSQWDGDRSGDRDDEDDDDNGDWNGYYDNAVYNDGYYNNNGYYNGGYYDPNAYDYGAYPYGYGSSGYDNGLGTIGTVLSLAQLAGVNLGGLGQLASLASPTYAAPGYYGGYGNPYSPQQLSGLLVSDSGSQMIVMTPNFTPVAVNAAPAYQLGYVPGTIRSGSLVNAVGYYDGNTFVATAIQ